MDYNYVRMRNAAHVGDKALTDHYKKLYEAGPPLKTYSVILNYIIILLSVIALALGVYIAFVVYKEMNPVVGLSEIYKLRRCVIC